MIILLNQASGASKVTGHVLFVWLENLYMDQLDNTAVNQIESIGATCLGIVLLQQE